MTAARKHYYRCTECHAKTSTTIPARAAAKVCVRCRPELDAAPARPAPPVPKPDAADALPAIKVEKGTLEAARQKIGSPNASFEALRDKGYRVMYLYKEPADVPASAVNMDFEQRRLTAEQIQSKYGKLYRQEMMAEPKIMEVDLDPAAAQNAKSERAWPVKTKSLGLLDAAWLVLRVADKPMRPVDIYDAIKELELWQPRRGGKTPWDTIAAAMMREWKKRSVESRFIKAGRGKFTANHHRSVKANEPYAALSGPLVPPGTPIERARKSVQWLRDAYRSIYDEEIDLPKLTRKGKRPIVFLWQTYTPGGGDDGYGLATAAPGADGKPWPDEEFQREFSKEKYHLHFPSVCEIDTRLSSD